MTSSSIGPTIARISLAVAVELAEWCVTDMMTPPIKNVRDRPDIGAGEAGDAGERPAAHMRRPESVRRRRCTTPCQDTLLRREERGMRMSGDV
ncbi:hypothetical protein [Burkholderia ubonensis]|uniref:hypothetical protein n=1 Tax=Burkholderia ubonensis TaxID=101571 RepID=UPI0018E10B35|nr:hypothetical protein [Burkholderia ubonensis]